MSKLSNGIVVLAGFLLAFGVGTAQAETAPRAPSAPGVEIKKSTLARANGDVLRQLRPSGLKAHATGFASVAERGWHDVTTIKLSKKSEH